jgi:hypothetical protein
MDFSSFLLDWSEVWALCIPLIVIAIYKPREKKIQILLWYVVAGLILNLGATLMAEYRHLVPRWARINNMVNNNILYNIHSILRVLLFGWYIITVRDYVLTSVLKLLLVIYVIFIAYNFTFGEEFFFLSTRLYATESILLLIVCFSYFFRSIQDESQTNWLKHPSFLVCSGISLYEVITFFIFLFFYPLSEKDPKFFIVTMEIYHIAFVILCVLLASAFYQSKKQFKKEKVL